MLLKAYAVVIFDNDNRTISFYSGADYVSDPKKARLFSHQELPAARVEQGAHQRFYPENEVRIVELRFEAPFELANGEPDAPLPPMPAIEEVAMPAVVPKVTMSSVTEANALAT